MSAVLAEFGGRFAERWAALLVLPGLLYVIGAVTAHRLGHAGWSDFRRLLDLPELAAGQGDRATPDWVVVVVALPVLSFIAALAARAFAAAFARLWFQTWPKALQRLAERLVARRLERWGQAKKAYEEAVTKAGATPSKEAWGKLSGLAAQRNAISLDTPVHPTWIGDRLNAVDTRVWKHYGLDVTFAWPRLWLVLNEAEQLALRAARNRLDAAVALAGWSVMCLLLVFWWWPAVLVAAALFGTAHRQARTAADGFAHLAESVFDLRGGLLAGELGCAATEGPLDRQTGLQVTMQLRKFA